MGGAQQVAKGVYFVAVGSEAAEACGGVKWLRGGRGGGGERAHVAEDEVLDELQLLFSDMEILRAAV